MDRRVTEIEADAPNRHLCLICNYNLHGLPDDHYCPECGWHYARLPWVWRKPIVRTFVSYVGLTLFMGCLIPYPLVWMALASFSGWRCWRVVKRGGEYVAILEEGIQFRLKEVDPRFLAWEEIQDLHAGKLDNSCLLVLREARNDEIVSGVFRSHEEVQEFVDLGRRRLEETAPEMREGA